MSLLAPEALAGVLSVALLYKLIARPFGPVAGLAAALVLAVTPITSVTDRNNTIDSLLILTLLLGAWAASRAAETGRLRWLLLGAVLVGMGFNIKMMQAYLVIPAFALAYGLGAPIAKRARLGGLALSCLVGLVVSLSWAVWVDLTPVADRPYVSDSGTNSALSLALGYNGLGRVTQALFSGTLRASYRRHHNRPERHSGLLPPISAIQARIRLINPVRIGPAGKLAVARGLHRPDSHPAHAAPAPLDPARPNADSGGQGGWLPRWFSSARRASSTCITW